MVTPAKSEFKAGATTVHFKNKDHRKITSIFNRKSTTKKTGYNVFKMFTELCRRQGRYK